LFTDFIFAWDEYFSDGLLQNVQVVFTKWKKGLTSYLNDKDEQVHMSILSLCLRDSCSIV